MRKWITITLLAAALLAACTPGAAQQVTESRFVTVYKLPT